MQSLAYIDSQPKSLGTSYSFDNDLGLLYVGSIFNIVLLKGKLDVPVISQRAVRKANYPLPITNYHLLYKRFFLSSNVPPKSK